MLMWIIPNPNAFINFMQLNDEQDFKYQTIAVPLAEGSIQHGRMMAIDEFSSASARARATAEHQRRKGNAK